MRWMTDYWLFVYLTTTHQLSRKGRIRCQDGWKWSEGQWPACSSVLCQMGLTKCRSGHNRRLDHRRGTIATNWNAIFGKTNTRLRLPEKEILKCTVLLLKSEVFSVLRAWVQANVLPCASNGGIRSQIDKTFVFENSVIETSLPVCW